MKVRAKRIMEYDGKTYKAGDVFETTDAKAKQLIDSGHAEELKPVGGVPEKSPEPAPKTQGGASTATAEPDEPHRE